MPPVLETKRLRLRPPNPNDLQNIYRLGSNPAVMKYISKGKTQSFEEAKADLEKRISFSNDKLGYWILEDKEQRQFIGWLALKPLDNSNEIEIGYRFLEEMWGKGFATEGSKRLLKYAFNELHLKQVVAIAIEENRASTRVMEKLGMHFQGHGTYYGVKCVRYLILKEEYDALYVKRI